MKEETKRGLWALGGVAVGLGLVVGLVAVVTHSSNAAASTSQQGQLTPVVTLQPGHRYKLIGQVAAPNIDAAGLQTALDNTFSVGLFTVQNVTVNSGQLTALVTYTGTSPMTIPAPASTQFTWVDMGT